MKKRLSILVVAFVAFALKADSGCPITNLVEILPYVERMGQALELGLPSPLTTNVTEFRIIWGGPQVVARIVIADRWQFGFNTDGYVSSFMDRQWSLSVVWKAEVLAPIAARYKADANLTHLTEGEAAQLAAHYVKRLGYDVGQALPPIAHQWRWAPKGTNQNDPLPFFTVKFPRKELPETDLYTVEVDGIRQRVNYFSTR
jgi:hypothetical protein